MLVLVMLVLVAFFCREHRQCPRNANILLPSTLDACSLMHATNSNELPAANSQPAPDCCPCLPRSGSTLPEWQRAFLASAIPPYADTARVHLPGFGDKPLGEPYTVTSLGNLRPPPEEEDGHRSFGSIRVGQLYEFRIAGESSAMQQQQRVAYAPAAIVHKRRVAAVGQSGAVGGGRSAPQGRADGVHGIWEGLVQQAAAAAAAPAAAAEEDAAIVFFVLQPGSKQVGMVEMRESELAAGGPCPPLRPSLAFDHASGRWSEPLDTFYHWHGLGLPPAELLALKKALPSHLGDMRDRDCSTWLRQLSGQLREQQPEGLDVPRQKQLCFLRSHLARRPCLPWSRVLGLLGLKQQEVRKGSSRVEYFRIHTETRRP